MADCTRTHVYLDGSEMAKGLTFYEANIAENIPEKETISSFINYLLKLYNGKELAPDWSCLDDYSSSKVNYFAKVDNCNLFTAKDNAAKERRLHVAQVKFCDLMRVLLHCYIEQIVKPAEQNQISA